ncbi:MAG: glycosyltransferase family 9 protein [Bacillota bacterium]
MNKKKILILDFLAIGDILFTTPLLETIRKNYKSAEIIMSIRKNIKDILLYNEDIDKLILYDKKEKHSSLIGYINYIKKIRKINADIVLTLQDNPRLALLAYLSKAPKRIGFVDNNFRKLFYTNSIKPNNEKHRVDYYLDIAKAMEKIKIVENNGLKLNITNKEKKWAKSVLDKNNINFKKKLVGLHIGGTWKTKRWPLKKFAELGDKLIDHGFEVIILGGPEDIQDSLKVVNYMKRNVCNLAGKTTLLQLAGLLDYFNLFISGDTGPLHMAVARNTKSLAIFGPSEVWRYRPYGQKHEVVKLNLECQPCHKKTCPYNWECMKNLKVEDVFKKGIRMLKY